MLKAGANPDGEALLKAAMYGNEECVDMLLRSGANVNELDAWSDTPLILAARCGNIRIVDLLLAAGADVNITSGFSEHEGRSVLSFAAHYNVDSYGYDGPEGSDERSHSMYEESSTGRSPCEYTGQSLRITVHSNI